MEDFRTNDIQIASFLFASGMKYKGVTKDLNTGKFRTIFIFENNEACRVKELEFINGGEVSALKLFSARDIFMNEVRK